MNGGRENEDELLASCYTECLRLAKQHGGITSIAFPCISTGVYGFPAQRAARIAVEACRFSSLDITFCCFSQGDLAHYTALLG